MSQINEIKKDNKLDLTKLAIVLGDYQDALDTCEDELKIKGKTLEQANIENPNFQLFYDEKRIELNSILKFMDLEVQRVRSKLYISYKENYSRELSEREINRYIDSEDKYLTVNEFKLEVQEMYDKYNAAVEAFKVRGYALNNITRARVSEVHDVIL